MERDEDFRRNDREIDTHFSNDDGYLEETAAEIAEPYQASRDRVDRRERDQVGDDSGSKGIGYTALAIAIISLFVLPVLLGVAAIVVGYIARRKEHMRLAHGQSGSELFPSSLAYLSPRSFNKNRKTPDSDVRRFLLCVGFCFFSFHFCIMLFSNFIDFFFQFFDHCFFWHFTNNFTFTEQ